MGVLVLGVYITEAVRETVRWHREKTGEWEEKKFSLMTFSTKYFPHFRGKNRRSSNVQKIPTWIFNEKASDSGGGHIRIASVIMIKIRIDSAQPTLSLVLSDPAFSRKMRPPPQRVGLDTGGGSGENRRTIKFIFSKKMRFAEIVGVE